MPGPKTAQTDIAPKIRKAFMRAVRNNGGIEYLENKIFQSMEKEFLPTLNALAKFSIKEKQINHDHQGEIKHVHQAAIGGWLDAFTETPAPGSLPGDHQRPALEHSSRQDGEDAVLMPERLVLPTEVCAEPEGRGGEESECEAMVIRADPGSPEEP